ncbi:hypothetical protein ACOQFV_27415 [Nocardiopsis changdeensis]|uniref:Uncharacterized protein n=1 Tax=Nocardiopsis changdeensis TaxID=2831969 RepID=A0ABX8BN35_9ACTN|nr:MULTISPECIES: hypothetical protein [Nocardiopsis]QUX22998.1 hypothetical protein KGD84_00875 [Nocardiopsis changdeensis]QYX38941.1 hypothetical protein K1J57_10325 [Nocardiopsis sp. MT53]
MTTPGLCRTPECERTTTTATLVCDACTHRLAVALADVPGLLAELDVEITRQARRPRPAGHTRPTEPPLPLDLHASEARDVLVRTLGMWRRTLAGDAQEAPGRPIGPFCRAGCGHPSCARRRAAQPVPRGATVAALLRTLIPDIRRHPEGGHLVDEITAAVDQARYHLYGADTPGYTLAGLCPDCGRPVYARPDAATAQCHDRDCLGLVDTAQWRTDVRAQLAAQVLPLTEVRQALTTLGHPVPLGTLKSWAHRGRLVPCWATDDGRQRPLYLVEDALALLTPTTTEETHTA